MGNYGPKKTKVKQFYYDVNGNVVFQREGYYFGENPDTICYQQSSNNSCTITNGIREQPNRLVQNQHPISNGNMNPGYLTYSNGRAPNKHERQNFDFNPPSQNSYNSNQNYPIGMVDESIEKHHLSQIPYSNGNHANKQSFKEVQQKIQPDQQQRQKAEQNKKLLLEQKHLKEKEAELLQIVQNYHKQIQQAEALGNKHKDPNKYKQYKAEATDIYILKIKQLKFVELEENQFGVSVKFIIGKISCGKSSLINAFFGTKLAVGVGQTTLKAGIVYQSNDVQIFDTPGQCDEFNTSNIEIVQYIASSNEVYILFHDSLKSIEQMVKVVAAIKPHTTYLIRTQCDRVNPLSNRTIREQLEQDKRVLNSCGIDLPIYAASAKKGDDFQDNKKVKYLMTTNPKKRMQIEK